jgi:hypothetical protein
MTTRRGSALTELDAALAELSAARSVVRELCGL